MSNNFLSNLLDLQKAQLDRVSNFNPLFSALMKEMLSDCLTSETRREGLKEISVSIHNLLMLHKEMTYADILENIVSHNTNTLKRRVYDVLSVMRALNLVTRNKKTFSLLGRNLLLEKKLVIQEKKKQLDNLKLLKEAFEYLVKKNIRREIKPTEDKYFLPFMIVVVEKNSEAHCETNEERTCFKFKSKRPMKLIEDLEILKEMYKLYKKGADPHDADFQMESFERFKESFSGVFDHTNR